MQKEFLRNPIERADELRFMPEKTFQYYMLGFIQFIKSEVCEPHWLPDLANSFVQLSQEKIKNDYEVVKPILKQVVNTLEYVANNQERFNTPENIYGNFSNEVKIIKRKIDPVDLK